MLLLNKHMKPRKFTLTHSGISSVFFLLRRPLVPLTDPCPEPTKLPSIEDRDDTLGDTEGEFLEGPRLWVCKVKKSIFLYFWNLYLQVLDYVYYHTRISFQNFFHSTIIPPCRVSWVSREVDKLKELWFICSVCCFSAQMERYWKKKNYKSHQNPLKSYCFLGWIF